MVNMPKHRRADQDENRNGADDQPDEFRGRHLVARLLGRIVRTFIEESNSRVQRLFQLFGGRQHALAYNAPGRLVDLHDLLFELRARLAFCAEREDLDLDVGVFLGSGVILIGEAFHDGEAIDVCRGAGELQRLIDGLAKILMAGVENLPRFIQIFGFHRHPKVAHSDLHTAGGRLHRSGMI